MMRKVQVFKWERQEIDGCTKQVKVADFIGTFHQFGNSYEEFESGAGNFTTLIVERDDGTICEAYPSMCQFITPIWKSK